MATRTWTPAEVTEPRIDGVHDRCSSRKAYLAYHQLVRLTRTNLATHSDRRYHFKKENSKSGRAGPVRMNNFLGDFPKASPAQPGSCELEFNYVGSGWTRLETQPRILSKFRKFSLIFFLPSPRRDVFPSFPSGYGLTMKGNVPGGCAKPSKPQTI
jgi:hypothetical protein